MDLAILYEPIDVSISQTEPDLPHYELPRPKLRATNGKRTAHQVIDDLIRDNHHNYLKKINQMALLDKTQTNTVRTNDDTSNIINTQLDYSTSADSLKDKPNTELHDEKISMFHKRKNRARKLSSRRVIMESDEEQSASSGSTSSSSIESYVRYLKKRQKTADLPFKYPKKINAKVLAGTLPASFLRSKDHATATAKRVQASSPKILLSEDEVLKAGVAQRVVGVAAPAKIFATFAEDMTLQDTENSIQKEKSAHPIDVNKASVRRVYGNDMEGISRMRISNSQSVRHPVSNFRKYRKSMVRADVLRSDQHSDTADPTENSLVPSSRPRKRRKRNIPDYRFPFFSIYDARCTFLFLLPQQRPRFCISRG